MGYDARSLQRLPQGKGADFPAFLTHKGAVDMLLVDLMRPFYDKGVRPEVCVCCHRVCLCLCLCLRLRLRLRLRLGLGPGLGLGLCQCLGHIHLYVLHSC